MPGFLAYLTWGCPKRQKRLSPVYSPVIHGGSFDKKCSPSGRGGRPDNEQMHFTRKFSLAHGRPTCARRRGTVVYRKLYGESQWSIRSEELDEPPVSMKLTVGLLNFIGVGLCYTIFKFSQHNHNLRLSSL
jgi:hypothetical protein